VTVSAHFSRWARRTELTQGTFMASSRNVVAIIDDDPGMREALESMLCTFGYRTELYASAEEFLRAAITTEAACLVVDIQLGDISGIELGRQLSATGFEFPIIFMTGSVEEMHRRQATDYGCAAYLQKPFPAKQLVEALSKAGLSCVSDSVVKTTSTLAASHRKQCEINAANCVKLARKGLTDEDRMHWLSMQRFWLERASLHDDLS
jgi:FixJ family two-component response regulator